MSSSRNGSCLLLLALAVAGLCAGAGPALAEPWPYTPFDEPHGLGNHFGEFQDYGSGPYYHDGIDLVTPGGTTRVYSVANGTVTHITYNDPYYSGIMIGEPVSGGVGWLYWHITSSTFQFDVGDLVQTNDYIGTTAWWPVSSFHHVHFNRVRGTGGYPWSWYTAIDNPLLYMSPNTDPDAPVFHITHLPDRFAFVRQGTTQILNPSSLSGNVDIIARISDIVGMPQWALNPWKIEHWILGAESSTPVTNTVTFSGTIPADATVSAIYCVTSPFQTEGDYDSRIYYFIVTNTDGDGVVESSDANYYWDTDLVPPGDYWVYVRATDVGGNAVTDSMLSTVAGVVDVQFDLPEPSHDFGIVPAGDSGTWELPIVCLGPDPLSVRSITSDNPVFTLSRTHFFVMPGETETVTVTFSPPEIDTYSGTLRMVTNDPDTPFASVAVQGSSGDPSAIPEDGQALPGERSQLAILGTRSVPGAGVAIDFAIGQAGSVSFAAYDANGRRVRDVVLATQKAGTQSWTWDGRDQAGRSLPAGAYFVRMQLGESHAHASALLLR